MDNQNCVKFITNMGRGFIAIVAIFLEWLICYLIWIEAYAIRMT